MDIKVNREILIGTESKATVPGTVRKGVDDAEAKALIEMGYASEVKGNGDAPENKTNTGGGNALADVLDGTVAEVTAALEGLSAADLRKLRDLETNGQARKGVLTAIEQYDLG